MKSDEKRLRDAISLGLWLVRDKGWSLKNGVKKASEKRDYKVKAHIEKGIREQLPEDFLIDRALDLRPRAVKEDIKTKAEKEKQRQHIKDILKKE